MGQGEDQPPKELLDLPAWQGEEARELEEPEAVANVKSMRLEPIEVPGVGPVDTCFMSLKPDAPADAPPLLLIHGFDSSLLEFRYLTQPLLDAGLRVEATLLWARAAAGAQGAGGATSVLRASPVGDGVVEWRLHGARALHGGDLGGQGRAVGPHPRAPARLFEAAARRH